MKNASFAIYRDDCLNLHYTNECSCEIYKTADVKTMNECWLGFHTFDVEMAIDDLKQIYALKGAE